MSTAPQLAGETSSEPCFWPADPPQLSIDPNGNTTSKTEGTDTWAYEWDAENRLKRGLKNGVEQARFAYDALGRRVEKVAGGITTTWTYDGGDVLREVSDAVTRRYVHGPGIDESLAQEDESGVLGYFHADGLGSIVKTSNDAGAVTGSRRYEAFGAFELGAANGYGFTGREFDIETGLWYYRARYYDPQTGRFIGEDPTASPGENRFVYAESDPVGRIDPTGLVSYKIIELCRDGYKVLRTVGFKEAVRAVLKGEDVLAPSTRAAKRVANAASAAKTPIRNAPHQPGFMRHFHPDPRTGSHIFYGLWLALFDEYILSCGEDCGGTVVKRYIPSIPGQQEPE